MAALSCRRYQVPLGRAFDLGVLVCPLGQAIVRLGCFAVAFFRIDRPPVFGPFNWMHLDSIVGLAVAMVLIVYNLARSSASEQVPQTSCTIGNE